LAQAPLPTGKITSDAAEYFHPRDRTVIMGSRLAGQGEESLAAVHHDAELEADLFEELGDEHQLGFAEDRDDQELAELIARRRPTTTPT
jgi:hypothetical protein